MTARIAAGAVLALGLGAVLVLTSCIPITAQPQFAPEVASGLREHPMRRLDTDWLRIYYPRGKRAMAVRMARRLEGCIAPLREHTTIKTGSADDPMVIVIPDMPMNNAYVQPAGAGNDDASVIPTHNNVNFAAEISVPLDPAWVGCHEVVHYVHAQQYAGLWRWLDAIVGPAFLTPQSGLDPWFWEGLATYYESRLQPGTGRLAWPHWRGVFHAAYAGKRIRGGDLSAFRRGYHLGNHYLVGSHFIEYLANTYGESKLWQLVGKQGRSWLFMLNINLRFRSVYGKTLSALIDDFADHVATHYPERQRPHDQRVIREVGWNARYARAADGTEAVITADRDRPGRLLIYSPDGSQRRSLYLAEITPPRTLTASNPMVVTGLSFTGDARHVYFAVTDYGSTYARVVVARYDIAGDELAIVHQGLPGMGGAVDATGTKYYFARVDGDRSELAVLDLGSGEIQVLVPTEPQHYIFDPRPSPDGTRIVASVFQGLGLSIQVFDARSGEVVATIAGDGGPLADASFADNDTLVFRGEHDRRFQVFVHALSTGRRRQVTDAPYVAFQPQISQGTLRFLNREGWRWTLDGVPLPQAAEPARSPTASPAAPMAAGEARASAAPPDRQITVHADRPYSSFDQLLLPRTRALGYSSDLGGVVSAGLAGGDVLSYHRWAVSGAVQLATSAPSVSVSYANMQLAPWSIRAGASWRRWSARSSMQDQYDLERRQQSATLGIERTFRNAVHLGLAAQGVDDERETEAGAMNRRRLAGATLALGYAGRQGTLYTGTYRALRVAGRSTFYPEALSTLDSDIADVRGALTWVTPLWLARRHTLHVTVTGRALAGSDGGLLQVGGISTQGARLAGTATQAETSTDPPVLPPGIQLVEGLRGFEDLALTLTRDAIAIGQLSYRYPVILDYGFASTLWLLPSLMLRQLDLELFAAGATDSLVTARDRWHAAAGGALTLELAFWAAPVSLTYQSAKRLSDDKAVVHSLFLSIGL